MSAIVATSSSQALWFVSRGTGAVSLVLVTISMLLGILTTARVEGRQWPRFVIERLHRNVSLSLLVFIAIHIASTVIDGFAPIGFLDAVVPFHSPYRTAWLGLGTLAFDLLLALAITSIVRARLGYRVWRAIHYAAYACWPTALVHGFEIGSDRHESWMLGLDLVSLVVVAAAVAFRVTVHPHDRPRPHDPAMVRAQRSGLGTGRAR